MASPIIVVLRKKKTLIGHLNQQHSIFLLFCTLTQVCRDDIVTSTSPSFNNASLTQNIGFAAQSTQNAAFNPTPALNANFINSNGFNGAGHSFNSFSVQNNGSTASSPLGDLVDEFDVISNRNKVGASPQPRNNGNE